MSVEERFMRLFAGLERAYGMYTKPDRVRDSGKNLGQAFTKKEPVTVELWRDHLEGKQGLGIVPIRDDNSCFFGAIDVDGDNAVYKGFDLDGLAAKVRERKMPLVVCRSKSGGAHLYLFSQSPIPAGLMRSRLREMATVLGFGEIEIFPKQSEIQASRGDVGGWINMPYFDAAETLRFGFDDEGGKLLVDEFLDYAESRRLPADFFLNPFSQGVTSGLFPEGPPCLQAIESQGGLQEGMRSNGLLAVAVFLRKAHPKIWREKLREYNVLFCHPPQDSDEVEACIKSVAGKRYNYTCKKDPINSFCDGAVCRTRKFGVGRDGPNVSDTNPEEDPDAPPQFPVLGQLRKLLTDPPTWFLDVNGSALEMSTEQLQNPRMFQRRCMDVCNFMVPIPTETSWQRMVQALMENVIHIQASQDSSPDGLLWDFLERYCTRSAARSIDETLNGRAWTDGDGVTWFSLPHFKKYLAMNQFKEIDPKRIHLALLQRGAVWRDDFEIRGVKKSLWGVPEFIKPAAREARPEEGVVF